MYKKPFHRSAAMVLAVILLLGTFMLTGCGKSYEYTFGDVEWTSSVKDGSSVRTIKDTYYYSDDWFGDNPSSENRELALASMQLAASCVSDVAGNTGEEFLKSMGFEEVGYSNFRTHEADDCSYTWARKTIGDATLVAVVIQSVNSGWKQKTKVWKQNFTVNDPESDDPSGEHYAYAVAADKVADDIAALAADGKTTFWITGQSRGGAIANVLSARLAEKADKAKIFAYTFEAPATVDAKAAGNYKFIHNYVCSDDLVTHVPLWGMTRYGVMHDLKTKETDAGLDDMLTSLGSGAAGMKERIITDDVVAKLVENLEAKVPSRAEYSAKRTDKWKDSKGKKHKLTYSYQEALVKMMDLVFREDSSWSLIEDLAAKRGDLEKSIALLTEGVADENSGEDPSAKYWEASKRLYAVLSDAEGGKMPVSKEDLYKVVRVMAPVLISVSEDGGKPDTELLMDVIGYTRELTYSHLFDTIIARLKILAPEPKK